MFKLPQNVRIAHSGAVYKKRRFCIVDYRLLTVAHGIAALPAPGIPAHIHQGLLCLPAQLFCGLGRIGIAGCQIAGAAVNDLVWQIQAIGLVEGLHHIQHAVADAGAQVEYVTAQVLHRVFHCCHMALCQIHHVDLVSDTGAIGGVVVIAKHA